MLAPALQSSLCIDVMLCIVMIFDVKLCKTNKKSVRSLNTKEEKQRSLWLFQKRWRMNAIFFDGTFNDVAWSKSRKPLYCKCCNNVQTAENYHVEMLKTV